MALRIPQPEPFPWPQGLSMVSIVILFVAWQGDPRVNIQNAKGKAKPYQVRQVLAAIERLEAENG